VPHDELAAPLARSPAQLGMLEELYQGASQFPGVGDFHGAAARHQCSGNVRGVGIVRSRDHGYSERSRFQQIVAADRR